MSACQYLFIGGPRDGEKHPVERGVSSVDVVTSVWQGTDVPKRIERYLLVELIEQDGTTRRVYRHHSVSAGGVIDALILRATKPTFVTDTVEIS